jgi:excisionase family DNA binding protein
LTSAANFAADRRRYIRVAEAAAYLQVAPRSLADTIWRQRHKVPALRVGRVLLFDASQLDQWLADLREHPQNGAR